jgi:SSS family solute:Na+ symporter
MASLVFILLIVACVNPENQITKEEFAVASNWTTDGLVAAVTLTIAIACGECIKQRIRLFDNVRLLTDHTA